MGEPHSDIGSSATSKPRVLFVDDEADLLDALSGQFAASYEVLTAGSGAQALALIAQAGPFSVIVTDMEMGAMNGVEFLHQARLLYPDTTRVMMTAHGNIETALRAVNDGHVFRFVVKPYRTSELATCLEQSVEQHRLVKAERDLLEVTLVNSIQMLVEVLSLVSPIAFGRANRVRSYARQVADTLHVTPVWEVELAALLCQTGCITVPPTLLAKALSGDSLPTGEAEAFGRLHDVSASLIDHIPRLERISRIIALTGSPLLSPEPGKMSRGQSFEQQVAAIVRAALDFDTLVSRGLTKSKALAELQGRKECYDSSVLRALAGLEAVCGDRRMTVVKSCDLNNTMVIRENITAKNGHLVVGKGQQVTKGMRALISSYVGRGILDDAISVYLPAESAKIRVAEIVPFQLTSSQS